MLTPQEYRRIYYLLDLAAPLAGNCGRLCNDACCKAHSAFEELGIYLLPGEEAMFSRQEDWLQWTTHPVAGYDFPPSWEGPVNFVLCQGTCNRTKRPIQCRTFPLAPHISDGQLVLIKETVDLPYRCPIIFQDLNLQQDFINYTYQAWLMLVKDPLIKDLVTYDSRQRLADRQTIFQVFP